MTKKITAVNNTILDVDLTAGRINRILVSDADRRLYLGGKGLAVKLLYEHLKQGIDALSPENILVMMTGPTAGTAAPAGGRFAVVCKSPLTGILASSYVGGRFGLSLKKAGYDGIMVRGRSDGPVYISINYGDVVIREASDSWGMDTYDFQEARKDEGDWVVIGPAGENLVRFAVIASGRRVAGRCGLGAVMGSKNLKGIVAKGAGKIEAADPEQFKRALKIAQKKVIAHENTGKNLRELGTPQNVRIYGTTAIMPVRNFSRSAFERMEEISAEKIRDQHKVKNHGCTGCPIKCGRTGRYRNREMISPEYETIAMMGSNLMVGDINQIAFWNEKLNRLGLDSISTGGVIGFAMELTERGMLQSNLSFGNPEGIDALIEDIAYRRALGNDLAEGVKRLSQKYGGQEFAIHVKGLEMAAYDPRGCTGQGLGFATANCGASHLSGSTHAVEADSYLSPHGTRGKAHFVKFMQDLTDAVNSAIFCIQTEYPFLEENPIYKHTPRTILRLLMRNIPSLAVATTDLSDYSALLSGLMGYKIKQKEFYKIGERIFNLERLMNCREGISRADDTLPRRMLEEAGEAGWALVPLDRMLKKYYRLRGWDENGHPKADVLERLGIFV
jgi:aldehyde:ferredoxin oxidoreductase